ncbi:MAG: OmpA family protein [Candidatus Kapabacteria bacterium]|nr:OmpA family protein [Candidatus Kapabacteria bacterium]
MEVLGMKNTIIRVGIVLVSTLTFVHPALIAQNQFPVEREWLAVHPRLSGMFNFHSPSFNNFGSVVDCGIFERGSGFGIGGGLTIEIPLGGSFHAGIGFLYTNRKGKLYTKNDSEPANDSISNTVINVVSENSLTVNLPYLEIMPELRAEIAEIGKVSIRSFGGIRFGIPLSPTYLQERRIVSPDYATYKINGKQTLDLSNGTQPIREMPSMQLGFSAGLESMLPIGKTSFFTQQIGIDYNIGNVATNVNWTVMSIRADLGLRFSLLSSPPPPPEPPVQKKPDTPVVVVVPPPPPPPPIPTLSVQLRDVNAKLQTGNELRASFPLVNAVFFDANSADIPERYFKNNNTPFETDDVVEYHRGILRSIANIMKQNPKASFVLEAATSGTDEKEGLALAKRRAETVKDALEGLGVPAQKISVKTMLLPRVPSNQEYAEGKAENRRVDIIVNDAPLQEYVARQKFMQLTGNVRLVCEMANLRGDVNVITNIGSEQKFSSSAERKIDFNERIKEDAGQFTIEANASGPSSIASRDELAINLSTLNREQIELNTAPFDAILRFDYNSNDLSQANKDLIRQLAELLPAGSTIEILGSADILGEEQRNKELSERRAKSTETFIRSVSGSKFTIVSSIAETNKFDDSKPEGRFLNRSIRIRVKQ